MAQFTNVAPSITASGTTWAQFKTGGIELILTNLIAANTALANPTVQATAALSATASSLPNGAYFASYSFVDAYGETLAGGESAVFTTTSGNPTATLTLPALPTRAKAINVYLTGTGGAAGTETLYATGITATTFALAFALPVDQSGECLPLANTTGAAAHTERLYALCTRPSTEKVLERYVETVSAFLSGDNVQIRDAYNEVSSWAGIFATWNRVATELNTLWVANFPSATISATYSPIGFPTQSWTLP